MSVEDEMIPELSLKQAYKLCRLESVGEKKIWEMASS